MSGRTWRILALLLLAFAVVAASVDESPDDDLAVVPTCEATLTGPDLVARSLLPADAGLVTRDVHDAFHPPRLG